MPITPFGRISTTLHMFPCRQYSVNLCPSTLLRHDLMHRIPEGSTISKFASAACRVILFPGFADLLTHDRLATHGSNHDRYLPWPNATALSPLSSIVAHSLVPQLTATLVEPAQRHQIDQSNGKRRASALCSLLLGFPQLFPCSHTSNSKLQRRSRILQPELDRLRILPVPFHTSMAISSPTAGPCYGCLGSGPHAMPTPAPDREHTDLLVRQLSSTGA